MTLRVRIEATDLPGRACGEHRGVHVGLQRGREPYELVAADEPAASWAFDVTTRVTDDGQTDFGGPFVQGRRPERFVYLTWGEVGADGTFAMFRRAKLLFADVDPGVLRSALAHGQLVGRLGLTDSCGMPLCARVRPPVVTWSAPG